MNGQQKKVRAVSKELDIAVPVGESDSQTLARAAVHPVLIAVQTTNAFKGDTAWKKLDIDMLFDRVQESVEKTRNGNLADLEAMLVAQAMTLQAIFSRLAMNASEQSNVKSYETFMGLALRAQAQSRSTIQAVVELKFPRQATFIKQGNFANGNQQVNNGIANSCTKEIEPTSANELSGSPHELLQDTGTSSTAIAGNPQLATVDKVDRATVSRRQVKGSPQRD